eukprot:1155378-Pelagomonas_calceolata.AAC.1
MQLKDIVGKSTLLRLAEISMSEVFKQWMSLVGLTRSSKPGHVKPGSHTCTVAPPTSKVRRSSQLPPGQRRVHRQDALQVAENCEDISPKNQLKASKQ